MAGQSGDKAGCRLAYKCKAIRNCQQRRIMGVIAIFHAAKLRNILEAKNATFSQHRSILKRFVNSLFFFTNGLFFFLNGLFIFKNSVFFCVNVAMLRCCLLRFAPIFGVFTLHPRPWRRFFNVKNSFFFCFLLAY